VGDSPQAAASRTSPSVTTKFWEGICAVHQIGAMGRREFAETGSGSVLFGHHRRSRPHHPAPLPPAAAAHDNGTNRVLYCTDEAGQPDPGAVEGAGRRSAAGRFTHDAQSSLGSKARRRPHLSGASMPNCTRACEEGRQGHIILDASGRGPVLAEQLRRACSRSHVTHDQGALERAGTSQWR